MRYAVVVGFDYHAQYLARVLNRDSGRWRVESFAGTRAGTLRALWALRRADVLVSFGGPGPSVALSEAAQARGVPVLVIWAGTDVQIAAANPFELAVTKRRGYENVAVATWLVDELQALGITAKQLSVAGIDVPASIAPLPATFRAITYLPEPRRSFYGEERVYSIARRLPSVAFTVLGPGGSNAAAPPNVEFVGQVGDVARRLDDSTLLLRLTEHDGASVIVLEALARGRHVVWTHDSPGVACVTTTEEAFRAVGDLYARHRLGQLGPNVAGHEFVENNFTTRDVARRFEAYLDELVERGTSARNGRQVRRVAISGLGLFSAGVAEQVERLRPHWKPLVVSTNSRLEVVAGLIALARAEVWYSIGSPITDRWIALCARILRKPRVIHWVGSDIESLRHAPSLRKRLPSTGVKHLAEVRWTADELRELGIPTEIAPLPLRHYADGVRPLPRRFTILLYVPKARQEFYGKSEYERILSEFRGDDVRAYVVGGGTVDAPPGQDVVDLGWRDDLRPIFEDATVLVRLTPRDGLSLMVLEALSFGRYVLWSKPFPFATLVRNDRDVVARLRELLERHRSGNLNAQYAAAEMVANRYSSEKSIDGILAAWEGVR